MHPQLVGGVIEAGEVLQEVQGIGIVYMNAMDVIRHDVVSRIVEAYDAWEKAKKVRAAGQENL